MVVLPSDGPAPARDLLSANHVGEAKRETGDPNGIQIEHLREWLSALETLKKAGIRVPITNPARAENAMQTSNPAS